jgi:hypothetical protein
MPTVARTGQSVRCRLETAPPDGFVLLRKLSYGETLERQDMAMTPEANADQNGGSNRGQRRRGETPQTTVRFRTSVQRVQEYEFSKCIVEHNLTDENGKIYDFSKPEDVDALDTQVGTEIAGLIDKLNEGADMAPFQITSSSPSSSPTEPVKSPTG